MHRTPRTPGALLGALALGLALAAPAGAQFAQPENASKNLKDQSQVEVKQTHINLKNPKNVLGLTLKGFKKNVAKGNFAPGDLLDVFNDLEGVQAEMAFEVQESVRRLRSHGNMLLTDLTNGNEAYGDGKYPENFYRGVSGTLDTFVYNMSEITRKSQRLMRQRMRALAKSLRRNTDLVMTSVVGPDVPLPSLVLSDGTVQPEEHLLSVDLLMASSTKEVVGDGDLCTSGTAMPTKGSVTVQVFDAAGKVVASEVVSQDSINEQDRWTACFSELLEGNYTVLASQDGNEATNEIGIR